MKKKISALVCMCILSTSISVDVFANEVSTKGEISPVQNISSVSENEVTPGNLEKIVQTIKSKVAIPRELSEFDYNYNSQYYNDSSSWRLTWSNEASTKQITITCDDKANILNYYNMDSRESGTYAPNFFKKDLKSTSNEFIKKVAPDVYKNIKYVQEGYTSTSRGNYTYNYERVENGISMPDNSVTVSVNYETGQVTSLSINYLHAATIPSEVPTVTAKKAAQLIGNTMKMNLVYQNSYDLSNEGNENIHAFLAYVPDQSYVSVDAKSAKVYTSRDEWVLADKESSKTEAADEAGGGKGDSSKVFLTEKEMKSMKELEGLIAKEDAIKLVTGNKSLLIESNLTSVTAKLSKEYSNYDTKNKGYIWNISFSNPHANDPSNKDTYNAYANASIDAKTGKILSFNASVRNYYDISEEQWLDIKVKYSKEQSLAILESFLKVQIPDRLSKSKISPSGDGYIIAYKENVPVYGGYNFNYNRVNENIEYPYNGIGAMVDGVTGKIYNFSSNWNDKITFESPKGVITPSEAFEKYIALEGYGLVYEINNIQSISKEDNAYSSKSEVRLVYRTDASPSTISPFSGKQMDSNGEVYDKKKGMYIYTDIDSNKYQRAISLLADMGIGFEGKKFLPNNKITAEELEILLTNIDYSSKALTAKEKTNNIKRVKVVKRLIKVAGLDKVAKLQNIYRTNFKDNKSIEKADVGYVALAQGLGIVSGSKLNPNTYITRGEAADMIINLLIGQSKLRD